MNERETGYNTAVLAVELVASVLEPGNYLQGLARTIRVERLETCPVVNIAIHRRVEVATGLVDATALAVEEPKQQLEPVAVRRTVHWNVVVTPSDLFDLPIHRLCGEGQLLIVTAFDVPPHVRSHGPRTAGLRIIVVAERRSEGKIASGDWIHDSIDDAVELIRSHGLTRDQVAIEHDQIRVFVIEDRVHYISGLDVLGLAIG
jgi:hypothetical protein